MLSTLIGWLCMLAGVAAIAAGAYGTFRLMKETKRVSLRQYVMTGGLMLAGAALLALGQIVRLLVAILGQA